MKSLKAIIIRTIWVCYLCSLSISIFSQSEPLDVQGLTYIPHSFYSYSSALVENEIAVIQEVGTPLTLQNVLQDPAAWEKNDVAHEPESQSVYWTRLAFHSQRLDTVLLEFGSERNFTWSEIEYYVVNQDSIIAQGRSGNRFLPKDKPIRSAVNLAQFPVAVGMNYLYCRLDEFEKITDDPIWKSRFDNLKKNIAFKIHDRSTYTIIDAFKFPGKYSKSKRGHFFSTNYFKQGIEAFVDNSKELSIEHVSERWDEYARFLYDIHPQRDSVYWMRFKIIGTSEGPGNYLFGVSSGSHWSYDSIEVYTRNKEKNWSYQLTGNRVKKSEKVIATDWNLFRVVVPPRDTQEVFLRMSGAGSRFAPMMAITQFEEDTFWPNLFTVQWIYGGFFSILITTALYFLILGYIEKRAVQYWFVSLIIGFGLLLGFLGADVNYFLFPAYEAWHPWLTAVGGFFVIVGLYKYIKDYLSLDRIYGIRIDNIFNPLILLHFLVCFNFGWSLYSIGGNVAIFESYFKLFIASIVLNFLIALTIGVIMLYRGNLYARFFVIAFGTLLIVLLIRLVFAFGSFSSDIGFNQSTIASGIYIHYLMFLGVILMIVLLAFGNGYRINQLKFAATNASFQSQQKEEINALLLEKNKLVESRAREKELLVKEIHHRVKNNLQILASLLNLQSNHITDEAAYEAIIESKDRVESMGLIHQLLYMGDSGVPSIDMQLYLDQLCLNFQESFIANQQQIHIDHQVSVKHLDIDTAISIGLTITELVTNAKKHAFGNERNGKINIRLWINEEGKLSLVVKDNGKGMNPDDLDKNVKSFGTELIALMTKKLKGNIEIESGAGYSTTVIYNKANYTADSNENHEYIHS